VIREYNLLMREKRETLSHRAPAQTARFYATGPLMLYYRDQTGVSIQTTQGSPRDSSPARVGVARPAAAG
jgi:hypothetical protein